MVYIVRHALYVPYHSLTCTDHYTVLVYIMLHFVYISLIFSSQVTIMMQWYIPAVLVMHTYVYTAKYNYVTTQ